MTAKRIFVAYADHEMTPKETEFFQGLFKALTDAGFEVSSRPNDRNHSGEVILDAVDYDLSKCECVVAFVNRHSTSVGRVLERSVGLRRPIVCLYQKGTVISRTIEGLASRNNITLYEYGDEGQAVRIALNFVHGCKA